MPHDYAALRDALRLYGFAIADLANLVRDLTPDNAADPNTRAGHLTMREGLANMARIIRETAENL